MRSKKVLSEKIKSLKIDMISTCEEKGINHSSTIRISQELDRLINEYMKLILKRKD